MRTDNRQSHWSLHGVVERVDRRDVPVFKAGKVVGHRHIYEIWAKLDNEGAMPIPMVLQRSGHSRITRTVGENFSAGGKWGEFAKTANLEPLVFASDSYSFGTEEK